MSRPTGMLAALQAAVRAALTADATLAGLVEGRIYDGPPRTGVTPYLAFAEGRALDWSHGDGTGARVTLALDALSNAPGRDQAVAIVDQASAVIEGATLTVAGGHLVLVRIGTAQVDRLRDGRTWRARFTLDALIDA